MDCIKCTFYINSLWWLFMLSAYSFNISARINKIYLWGSYLSFGIIVVIIYLYLLSWTISLSTKIWWYHLFSSCNCWHLQDENKCIGYRSTSYNVYNCSFFNWYTCIFYIILLPGLIFFNRIQYFFGLCLSQFFTHFTWYYSLPERNASKAFKYSSLYYSVVPKC